MPGGTREGERSAFAAPRAPAETAVVPRHSRCASAAVAFCVAFALVACGPAEVQREVLVFGTTATLALRGPATEPLERAADDIERRLATREREWHPWRDSDLTRLNAALARGEAAPTTPAIIDLIARARPLVADSEGTFDPAAGALVRAWGFHTGDWPSRIAVDAALIAAWPTQRPRFDDLVVEGDRVRAVAGRPQLDFNAIAEGVAAVEALSALRRHGVRSALLDLGGDVVARGDAGGRPWRVALRDPGGGVLGWVDLADGEALFASGAYAKFRADGTRRRPHVVDPRSGQTAEGSQASAVLLDDPVRADAGATALMVSGAAQFAQRVAGMRLRCALLLTDDDVLHLTAGLDRRLVLLREPARKVVHPGPEACRATG